MLIFESLSVWVFDVEFEGKLIVMFCYGCNECCVVDLQVCFDCGGSLIVVEDVDFFVICMLIEMMWFNVFWVKDEFVGWSFGFYEMKVLLG